VIWAAGRSDLALAMKAKRARRIDLRRQPLNPHTACGGAETIMPRTSWKGFLRLSLVSCPVYLLPATSRTKAIRLHQVWVPGELLPPRG
jgi:hypothetical protein